MPNIILTAQNNGNILSKSNTSLSFTTNGKTNDDQPTILKTDYSSNLAIDTPAPSIWGSSMNLYGSSVNQKNPITAKITGFDSNTGEYTVEYTWKHNNPNPAYYTGNIVVTPDNINNIPANGGTKTFNISGIKYNAASNLTINRYCPVALSGTIPGDSASNQGGSVNDDKFYYYEKLIRNGGSVKQVIAYGPAQSAGTTNDLSGVLTLSSDQTWLTFDNGASGVKYTFSNDENKFSPITVNATANTPSAKYGTASASLDFNPKQGVKNTAITHTITLSGLKKLTDADNTRATTQKRTATINYQFNIGGYQNKTADGNLIPDITPQKVVGSFGITQDGGDVSAKNPQITYSLTYTSVDYFVPGDNFKPVKKDDTTFTIDIGSTEGSEGEVNGNVSGDFPDSFEPYGGTTNVTVGGLGIVYPVDYNTRQIKLTATGRIDYVDKVNDSTTGVSNHTYTTSEEIIIPQLGKKHDVPEAEIEWYIDSEKTNSIPSGKSDAPLLTINSSNPMSLGKYSKSISLTASSNEAAPTSGGVTGDLKVTKDKSSVPSTGGTVTITCDTSSMNFAAAKIPATDSAYFRVRGYSTSNTKGIDHIATVKENSFGYDFSDAETASGNLVFNKLIYIKGQPGILNGIPSSTVTFNPSVGTTNPTSLTFNSTSSSKQTLWTIPSGSVPVDSLSYSMSADKQSVYVKMEGPTSGPTVFKFTYDYNGNSKSFYVTREAYKNQIINTTLNVSGATDYLNTNGASFPMTYNCVVGNYTFTGWSFKNDTRTTKVDSVSWDSSTLDFGATSSQSSKNAVLTVNTSLEDYTPKTITFTLTGTKQYPDGSGISKYAKSWVTEVPFITREIFTDAPTISVSPEGYENYFTYTFANSIFTATFKNVAVNESTVTINTPTYNQNGWDKYFTVNYSGASGGDSERTVTVTASSGGKSATLTCHRGEIKTPVSSAKTITFNVTNNNPDFVTLSCPTTSIAPNTTASDPKNSIRPIAQMKTLSSISLDKFDNYNTTFKGQGASKTLDAITTDITAKDKNGNPQVTTIDALIKHHFYSGFSNSGIPSSIVLTKNITGKVVCNQDTTKSSNYKNTVSKTVENIINSSNPVYTWSITNNSGAGFLSIDNSGTLTINPDNYKVSSENGVDETVTCTVKIGSPAKEYLGRDTLSVTKTLHVV